MPAIWVAGAHIKADVRVESHRATISILVRAFVARYQARSRKIAIQPLEDSAKALQSFFVGVYDCGHKIYRKPIPQHGFNKNPQSLART